MIYVRKLSITIVLAALFFLVASCAGLKINPPDQSRQTLLVLPVEVINTAQRTGRHGFYYIYEIVNEDDSGIAHKAIFRLPLKGDMLIVDSLPPGNYVVDKFIFKTVGSGDFTYGNNVENRHDRFQLESGKITILSKSLNVKVWNSTPGRGSDTSYSFKMVPLSRDQEKKALQTLQKLENFDQWKLND